jgi:ATP-dependent RNA helicase DDX51/DBP6
LKYLQFLVIDEADRIMQHIQNDWLHHLNRHWDFGDVLTSGRAPPLNVITMDTVKKPPQKLFFSATLSQDPEMLQEWGLFQPKLFSITTINKNESTTSETISKYTTPLELREKYLVCDIENKPSILYLLLENDYERALVFLNSTQGAHRLAILLKNMMKKKKVVEMSSTHSQKARNSILKDFQLGKINM